MRRLPDADKQSDATGAAVMLTELGATDRPGGGHRSNSNRQPALVSWERELAKLRVPAGTRRIGLRRAGDVVDPNSQPNRIDVKREKLDLLADRIR